MRHLIRPPATFSPAAAAEKALTGQSPLSLAWTGVASSRYQLRLIPRATLPRRVDEYFDVAAVDEIPVGRVIARMIGDRRIAVGHSKGGIFALDNTCPHRGGPLAEGDLIGDELICPWHLWAFDVRTGNCPGGTTMGVAAHEVRIEKDRVLVRLSPARPLPELM